MKRLFSIFLMLGCFAAVSLNAKSTELKVFQINLWHEGTKVPGEYQNILNVIDEIDADVVLLCEIRDCSDRDGLLPRLKDDLRKRGKKYYGGTEGLSVGILSKIEPEKIEKCAIVPGDKVRPMLKATLTIGDQPVSLYACHLDYTHYECYMPRGYSGTSWKKIPAPITDEKEVLAANRLSYRDESITAFIEEAQKDIENGRIVIMGGDFNEPSHLDWQTDTKDLFDHNGAVINWDCSVLLHEAGFVDSFRKKYPDAVKYPAFTFPAGNRAAQAAGREKLAWAPEADERDRIDFIYYHASPKTMTLKDCIIVGPAETVLRGKIVAADSKDKFLTPQSIWPSDHKGNLVTFRIKSR